MNKKSNRQIPQSFRECYEIAYRIGRDPELRPTGAGFPCVSRFNYIGRADGNRVCNLATISLKMRPSHKHPGDTAADDLKRILYRAGQRFERATLRRDFAAMAEVEELLTSLAKRKLYTESWFAPAVCAGQNSIRRLHNLEEVHA